MEGVGPLAYAAALGEFEKTTLPGFPWIVASISMLISLLLSTKLEAHTDEQPSAAPSELMSAAIAEDEIDERSGCCHYIFSSASDAAPMHGCAAETGKGADGGGHAMDTERIAMAMAMGAEAAEGAEPSNGLSSTPSRRRAAPGRPVDSPSPVMMAEEGGADGGAAETLSRRVQGHGSHEQQVRDVRRWIDSVGLNLGPQTL